MEKERIELKDDGLIKVELNKEGEYISVSPKDSELFDRFVKGAQYISDLSDEIAKKVEQIEKQYNGKEDFKSVVQKASAMSKENVRFSTEAVKTIDGIFGEETIKKYFRNIYREIPDFLPDADCITDFFEQITPVIERVFSRRIEQLNLSRKRMARYQPQDHKKPQRGK